MTPGLIPEPDTMVGRPFIHPVHNIEHLLRAALFEAQGMCQRTKQTRITNVSARMKPKFQWRRAGRQT